jgi:hypothetical protein
MNLNVISLSEGGVSLTVGSEIRRYTVKPGVERNERWKMGREVEVQK